MGTVNHYSSKAMKIGSSLFADLLRNKDYVFVPPVVLHRHLAASVIAMQVSKSLPPPFQPCLVQIEILASFQLIFKSLSDDFGKVYSHE